MKKILGRLVSVLSAIGLLAAGTATWTAVLPVAEAQARENCYVTFWPNNRWVEMDVCEHGGGSTSGFTRLVNTSDFDVSVCWTIEYENGSTERGCNSRLRAGQEAEASCHNCYRPRTGGAENVIWRDLRRLS